jgi:hypothetical protein
LQSFERQYAELEHVQPYIVTSKALGTSSTVIAFPIKNKEKGYVVMLAQAQGNPIDKRLPEVMFVVNESTFSKLKSATTLSSEVELLIRANIK